MKTIVGVFVSRTTAERAVSDLRSLGIPDARLSLLSPGASEREMASVPLTETEQPGVAKAIGGVVGGAIGVAGGIHVGTAVASLLVPGVGPVVATGLIGAAILGAGGIAAGAATGDALEEKLDGGVPRDELFVYEDALRRGRSVVITIASDDAQAERAREMMAQAGAESLDAAREAWWIGLRNAEREKYSASGRDFVQDERTYRCGFQAALDPQVRGKPYSKVAGLLRRRFPAEAGQESFRLGYKSGQEYQRRLEKSQRAA